MRVAFHVHDDLLQRCSERWVTRYVNVSFSRTIPIETSFLTSESVWGMSGVTATSSIAPAAPIPTVEVPAVAVPAGRNSTSISDAAETLVPAAALSGPEAAAIAAAPLDRVPTIEVPATALPVVAVQVASAPKLKRVSFADKGPQ